MSLYVLDVLIWILGMRGHIPQSGEFAPIPDQSSIGASIGVLMRGLFAFIVATTCLSLVLWVAVWFAIKLL